MSKEPEKVRLLLLANEDKQGTRKRPYYVKNCCLLTLLQIFCFFLLLIILAFIAKQVVRIEDDITPKSPTANDKYNSTRKKYNLKDTIPGSDFCKSVNAENMSLVALGYLTGIKEEKDQMDSKNKIYYLTNRLFTDQEACSIEAHLRLFQDKSIFVIEIGNLTENSRQKVDYVQFLQEQYTNLNTIKSTYEKFFKGSPFQNKMKAHSDFSIFAAKVLLVWQFGGMVLSPDFLMLSRRPVDSNEGFCEVDRDLLFCPNQCSAYVYQLVKIVLDSYDINQNKTTPLTTDELEHIVNKSVADYCGDTRAAAIGCVGVNRIKSYRVCQKPAAECHFLRVREWKQKDMSWKSDVQKLCPKIVTKFVPNLPFHKCNKETHFCRK